MRRALALLGALAMVVALAAGCGDDDDSAAEGAGSGRFPPGDVDELRALFEDELDGLGLRLTRGSLVDSETDYDRSDDGTHLAVYVEPTSDEYDDADYIHGLHRVTAVFAPTVFERWAGLQSFDVCQEPPPGVDDRDEPTPLTQINLTRDQSAAIDWEKADTATIVAASLDQPDDRKILRRLDLELARDPAWVEVQARALELAGR